MREIIINILYVASGLPLCYACVFGWGKLLNKETVFKNYRVHLIIFAYALLLSMFATYFNTYIKFSFFLLAGFFFNQFIYTKSVKQNITVLVVTELFAMLSEVIIALTITFLLSPNNVDFVLTKTEILILNCIIAALLYVFFQTKIPIIVNDFILNITSHINSQKLMFYNALLLATAIVFLVLSYKVDDTQAILTINTSAIIVYSTIVTLTIITNNKYEKVTKKYNMSLVHLQEYEKTIDEHLIINHENKNHLNIIREMIIDKEDNVLDFINTLLNDKCSDKNKLIKISSKIPSGGLRATIHLKLQKMKKLHIKHELHVCRDVKASMLLKLGDELLLNICTIINIYLDNAIEHIQKAKVDKKVISISIHIENGKLCISIGNSIIDKIDINRIEEKGYSTKGDKRGYGLTLAREIINKNKRLKNEHKLNNNYFTQTLKIKM